MKPNRCFCDMWDFQISLLAISQRTWNGHWTRETEAMSTRYVVWFITYGWCVWYRNIKIHRKFDNKQDKKIFDPADSRPLLPFNKYFLNTSSEPGLRLARRIRLRKKERKRTRILLEFTFSVFISYTHPIVYETNDVFIVPNKWCLVQNASCISRVFLGARLGLGHDASAGTGSSRRLRKAQTIVQMRKWRPRVWGSLA